MDATPPGGSRSALALGVGVGDHLLVGVDALHQPAARQQPVLHRRVGARPAARNGGWRGPNRRNPVDELCLGPVAFPTGGGGGGRK